jgi:hypothetical protein
LFVFRPDFGDGNEGGSMLNARQVREHLLFLVLAACVSATALAQTKPKRTDLGGDTPTAILWVGNSFFYYNNSLHNHVINLVRAADPKSTPRATSVTISGSGIDWHDMESYFRPNGIGRYSFVGDNEIVFNKAGRQFDAVIIADCSQCPIHPQLKSVFHQYARKQSEIATANGARPIFFMTWAYKDKPEMTAQLAEQYTIAGNDNDALVIPAGLAFAKAVAKRPDLEFYQSDKRHPTLIGTYLAACTTYAAVYKKSPVGNTYTADIDPATAGFLQNTAQEAVREYFAN